MPTTITDEPKIYEVMTPGDQYEYVVTAPVILKALNWLMMNTTPNSIEQADKRFEIWKELQEELGKMN